MPDESSIGPVGALVLPPSSHGHTAPHGDSHAGPIETNPAAYFGELRQNVRALAATGTGIAVSLPLFSYTNSVFAPFLLKEFGWSRSQFAMIGLAILATLVFLPFIGRFTDKLGVRRIATTGTFLLPLCFIGLSTMNGSFALFIVLTILVLICGTMTSQLVYTRLIAERFDRAQGLALTIVNCAPAALAIAVVPALNLTIELVGWRLSYLFFAAFCFAVGCLALYLVPSSTAKWVARRGTARRSAFADFRCIAQSRVFWIILSGMFLCLLQTQLHTTQMNLMLLDQGLTSATAARIISVYALGTIVGRVCCGLALDRYSTPLVTFMSMSLPAGGFFLLGTHIDTPTVIWLSMFVVGLSVGAESDLISFLVSKYFKIEIFSSTLSILFCCSYFASAMGSLLLSYTLSRYDSFSPFLYFIAGMTLLGGLIFLLLPRTENFDTIG